MIQALVKAQTFALLLPRNGNKNGGTSIDSDSYTVVDVRPCIVQVSKRTTLYEKPCQVSGSTVPQPYAGDTHHTPCHVPISRGRIYTDRFILLLVFKTVLTFWSRMAPDGRDDATVGPRAWNPQNELQTPRSTG